MNKQEIIRYLQSIIAIPILAIAMPLSGVASIPNLTAVNSTLTEENSVIITQEEVIRKEQVDLEVIRKEKAEAIDAYFAKYDAPLEGYGMKFVIEAEKNDIDWRLLPAIAMRESTGGIWDCDKATNSVFGWGSCKISFKSIDESIEIVTRNLGGNNPNTARHYDGKTTLQILRKYNSYIKNYPAQVVKIMKKISDDGKEII
ncbi:MAG: hypothetical protein WC908_00500 [Candidatus Paceibacterota bacterium]